MLAAKLLEEQGVDVLGICFASNFYSCEKAEKSAAYLNLPLQVVDISREMLELTKNPPTGYGKHMNPCIDCHAMMIRKAGEIANEEGYDVVATGEVLGQRPFSQNREALARVAELAGREVVRPLSAKLLPETEAENSGILKRSRLRGIKGRGREQQLELAGKFNIREYESPAGGCLLTDEQFSERLIKMLDYWPDCDINDVELLKNGRVFWFRVKTPGDAAKKVIMIIGRNEQENNALEELVKKGDFVVQLNEINGPVTILRWPDIDPPSADDHSESVWIPNELERSEMRPDQEKDPGEAIRLAQLFTGYYAVKARGKRVFVRAKKVKLS